MGVNMTRPLTRLRAIVAAAAIALTGCRPLGGRPPRTPLDAKGQAGAAERLASAFEGPCLASPDALAVVGALRSSGWPPFNTVWRKADGAVYAAPPSPAAVFVIEERPWAGTPAARRLTCVGHYTAGTAGPMIDAISRRWGPGEAGTGPYRNATVWRLRVSAGRPIPTPGAPLPSPAAAAGLARGEADVIVQISRNPGLNDVASVLAVSRSTR